MALQTIAAELGDDLQQVKEEFFGKAFFTCKTKPKTKAMLDNLAGKITMPDPETGKRLTYWVVAKPNRQQGAKPKEKVTITIDADVLTAIDALADRRREYRSTVVETALQAFLESQG